MLLKKALVLAASVGGPETVKAFLDHLPSGLEFVLLYVQHNDAKDNSRMVQALIHNSEYDCRVAEYGEVLSEDTVTLVSGQQLDILADGTMGARLMARRAGQIWIQSPVSCVADSMPKAINRTGRVTATGTPEKLAGFYAMKNQARSAAFA